MSVNKIQINLSTITSGTTFVNFDIPISLDSQNIGQSDVIDRDFVNIEVENAINPISDYDKVRFLPLDNNNVNINNIIYQVNISGTTYADIGFDNDDIKFERDNFKNTFLYLAFYDTNNPMNQRLVSYVTLFSSLKPDDLLPSASTQIANFGMVLGSPGQPKPAYLIPVKFTLTSPIFDSRGFAEGYHLYDYRDELLIGQSKYLYMRASFKNAKTGKSTNLMVKNNAQPINLLVNEVYTRYKLFRTSTGYYYQLDDMFNGNGVLGSNNVTYSSNNIVVSLYEIKAL